jgi:hypothetical protein
MPAATVANTPEAPKCSAIRNEPNAATAVRRRLDQMIVGGSRDHDRNQPNAESGGKPAAGDYEKGHGGGKRALRVSRVVGRPDEDEREQDRGGAVVEQALGFDEEAQPAGHARFPQERDDRDRVGRADQRAEDESGFERPAKPDGEPARHDERAEHDPHGRQRDHRNEIALEIAPAQVQRRLEQERRQDNVEDQVVGQRQARLAAGGGERRPGEHEADRIGQAEAARGKRDQNREAK